MKRMYSKKAAYKLGYCLSFSYNNGQGLGEENIQDAINALEANHKDEDFVYIKTDNKMSFHFKVADYALGNPDSLNNRVDRSVRSFLFK